MDASRSDWWVSRATTRAWGQRCDSRPANNHDYDTLASADVKALAYINLNNLKQDVELRTLPKEGVPKEGGEKYLSNFSALRAAVKELIS